MTEETMGWLSSIAGGLAAASEWLAGATVGVTFGWLLLGALVIGGVAVGIYVLLH
jgi:hypothetical protein